ncbi:chromatin modification-related protein EAF7-like [Neodiprion virginianus]|uniref:chromatin modification-related protein EAF7-like n=1 Tax=Neodiprion virginianus TaxID=2961670 RepID=UPI001EE77C94|nr:chromatin modification-related protein EAF7-like [Neodiprion virginianus]
MVVERSLEDIDDALEGTRKVATIPGEPGGSGDKEKENKGNERMPRSTPVEKMSVKELTSKLERLKLPTEGKKAQLVSRLRRYEENAKDDGDSEGSSTSEDENTGDDDAESSEAGLVSEQTADTDDDDRNDRGAEARTRRRRDEPPYVGTGREGSNDREDQINRDKQMILLN